MEIAKEGSQIAGCPYHDQKDWSGLKKGNYHEPKHTYNLIQSLLQLCIGTKIDFSFGCTH